MTVRGSTVGTPVQIMLRTGLPDQRGALLGRLLMRLRQRVVVPLVRRPVGVPGLAHRDVLADSGSWLRLTAVCRPPSWYLITGTPALAHSCLNRLLT